MKKLLLSLLVLTMVATFAEAKKDAAWVIKKAEVKEDVFDKLITVSFPKVRPNQLPNFKDITGESAWSVPPGFFFIRTSLDAEKNVRFLQVYFSTDYAKEWGFYNAAKDSAGNELKFTALDTNVSTATKSATGAKAVLTIEDFVIDLDIDYLKNNKDNNLLIKVYGKKKTFVFYIPQYYLEGVYNYINK